MSRVPISALGFLGAAGAAGSPMVQWVLHRCGTFPRCAGCRRFPISALGSLGAIGPCRFPIGTVGSVVP